MKNRTQDADSFSYLLALARGVRDGRAECAKILARRLQKSQNPKAIIKQLSTKLMSEEAIRQRDTQRRKSRQDHKERLQFPLCHPLFRKRRNRKGREQTDAMHRAILCGGFEMNRSRH
ncbi:hypothetical protein [Marinobacter nauticus]|uniref:hypothetical protein n=1 Tax=Marinobacter nauticus TaxID=2743 RepID=UPI00129A8828|nr:hypothetical protein [Marinobacter nauticus]